MSLFSVSKDMLTTLLNSCEAKPAVVVHERHMQFKIKELDDEESLKLFSWCAFGQDHPPKDLMEHSVKAIQHCGGLSLALQDLGSSLFGRSMDVWRSKLEKLETILHHKIQKNLEISLEPLDDYDKRLFVLIACHFVGKDKDYAVDILEKCDLHPVVGIQNLIDRSLVTVDNDNMLMMPRLLQNMGKEILGRKSWDGLETQSQLLCQLVSSIASTENTGRETDKGLVTESAPHVNGTKSHILKISGQINSAIPKRLEKALSWNLFLASHFFQSSKILPAKLEMSLKCQLLSASVNTN